MKLLLFKVHQGDPLGGAIQDVTRTVYTHAAILKDEATNTISEAYFPHVRERVLDNAELAGIDAFDISTTFPNFTALTPEQVAAALDHCAKSEAEQESYAIRNLFAFLPGVNEVIKGVKDDGTTSPIICSQYAFDVVAAAGVELLNTDSGNLAPGYLAWSPMLKPAKPLLLIAGQTAAPKPTFAQELKTAVTNLESVVTASAPGVAG